MNKTLWIQEGDEGRLEKAVKRLNRHAQKMGYAEVKVVSIGKPVESRRTILNKSEDGEVSESSYAVTIREVIIDLPEQFLNYEKAEWNVIGQVVHMEDGKAEIVAVENFVEVNKVAEGFNWKCGDCGHALGKAFVVQNKADASRYVLVGQECLKKYTGADGHAVLAAIEVIMVLQFKDGEGSEGGYGVCRHYRVYDLDDFMAVSLAVAEKAGGYVKRWVSEYDRMIEQANCTRNMVLAYFDGSYKIEVSEAHKQQAEVQIEAWKNTYIPERNGAPDEYVTQCKFIAERGWVSDKTAGVAASMVKEPPKPPKDYSGSKHLGVIGERQVFENLTVVMAIQREGNYGMTTILKFEDADNNVLTWFASGVQGYQKGDKVTLKASVKAHDEYKGVKQTVIIRAKEIEVGK